MGRVSGCRCCTTCRLFCRTFRRLIFQQFVVFSNVVNFLVYRMRQTSSGFCRNNGDSVRAESYAIEVVRKHGSVVPFGLQGDTGMNVSSYEIDVGESGAEFYVSHPGNVHAKRGWISTCRYDYNYSREIWVFTGGCFNGENKRKLTHLISCYWAEPNRLLTFLLLGWVLPFRTSYWYTGAAGCLCWNFAKCYPSNIRIRLPSTHRASETLVISFRCSNLFWSNLYLCHTFLEQNPSHPDNLKWKFDKFYILYLLFRPLLYLFFRPHIKKIKMMRGGRRKNNVQFLKSFVVVIFAFIGSSYNQSFWYFFNFINWKIFIYIIIIIKLFFFDLLVFFENKFPDLISKVVFIAIIECNKPLWGRHQLAFI